MMSQIKAEANDKQENTHHNMGKYNPDSACDIGKTEIVKQSKIPAYIVMGDESCDFDTDFIKLCKRHVT